MEVQETETYPKLITPHDHPLVILTPITPIVYIREPEEGRLKDPTDTGN